MADGAYIEDGILAPIAGLSASHGSEHDIPLGERTLHDSTEIILQGSFTNNLPVDVRSLSLSGEHLTSFFDDFYNRIYFLPTFLDFGAIVGDATQSVIIWNAYLMTQTLTGVVGTDNEGVSLSGEAAPVTFKPLATETYEFTVGTDGPPTLDATYTFTFGTPFVFELPLSGSRARLWPLLPNWSANYRVQHEFKTEIITSRSGREQRRAMRQNGRKTVEFTCVGRGDTLRQVNRLLDTWQNKTFVIPELPRFAVVSSGIPAEALVVEVDSVPDWLIADSEVVLANGDDMELRIVDSVTGSEITFSSISAKAWPAGTKIHPGLTARAVTKLSTRRLTNGVAEISAQFEIPPGTEAPLDGGSASTTFNGREVFLNKPNWATPVNITHEWPVDRVDFEIGRVSYHTPIDFGTRLEQAAFVGRDFDDADAILRFFTRMRGQQGEFYMPTWENDLPLKITAPSGSNSIRVDGTETADSYADHTLAGALCVSLTDGTTLLRLVEDVFTVDDATGHDTVVQCTGPWPHDLTADNVAMISWMPVWRHATDGLTVDWVTNSAAQVQLSMRTLEALPTES